MKTARTLLILGIWIAILPYLGFPYSWKKILLTLSGLGVAYVAYILYKKEKIEHDTKLQENLNNLQKEVSAILSSKIETTKKY